jgi:ketosteroid isomerase-like protein
MKMMLVVVCLLLVTASFATDKKAASGEELLRQLEADFAADVARRGHDAYFTRFADDGVEIVNGAVASKEQMKKESAWPEGTSLTWTPEKAEMSASGDLGYTYGSYVFTFKGADGQLVPKRGKYMSIWKKQGDGQWKVAVDMGSVSPDAVAGK